MNLFYLKNHNQKILMWLTIHLDCIVRKMDNNYFYYYNDKLVGFNIFLDEELNLKPGRIILTSQIANLLNNKYKINIDDENNTNFVVGKIINIEKIENTHLSLCQVNIDKKVLEIICGANNVRNNLKVVVAPVGIIMNNGLEIKPSKIQGYNSFGMLCSQNELQINGFNEQGIIELDDNYLVGDVFLPCYSNK